MNPPETLDTDPLERFRMNPAEQCIFCNSDLQEASSSVSQTEDLDGSLTDLSSASSMVSSQSSVQSECEGGAKEKNGGEADDEEESPHEEDQDEMAGMEEDEDKQNKKSFGKLMDALKLFYDKLQEELKRSGNKREPKHDIFAVWARYFATRKENEKNGVKDEGEDITVPACDKCYSAVVSFQTIMDENRRREVVGLNSTAALLQQYKNENLAKSSPNRRLKRRTMEHDVGASTSTVDPARRLVSLSLENDFEIEFVSNGGAGDAVHGRGNNSVANSVNSKEGLPDLPEEIWEMILRNLVTLDDKRNAINSFAGWKTALRKDRKLFLFPNVFPFLSPYLCQKDILNCRKVCSNWRQGIDEFLEGAAHLAPYSSKSSRSVVNLSRNIWANDRNMLLSAPHAVAERLRQPLDANDPVLWSVIPLVIPYIIQGTEENQSYWNGNWQAEPNPEQRDGGAWRVGFFEAMQTHPSNPFVGRALKIEEELPLDAILNFPPRFGQHLWYLDLTYANQISYISLLSHVCFSVKILPNLRRLRISAKNIFICDSYTTLKSQGLLKLQLPEMPQGALSTLQTLQFDLNYDDDEKPDFGIEDMLLKRFSPQLGRFEVAHWNHKDWCNLPFPKLTELHITTMLRKSTKTFKSLIRLKVPLLQKLVLKIGELPTQRPESQGCNACCWNVCRLLKHFKKLQHFAIHIQNNGANFFDTFGNTPFAKPVSFRSIKTLVVNHQPVNRRFLLHFPKLQYLHIVKFNNTLPVLGPGTSLASPASLAPQIAPRPPTPPRNRRAVALVAEPNEKETKPNVFDSEIWTLIPSLKEISVSEDYSSVYRRSDFENYALITYRNEKAFVISDHESPRPFYTFRNFYLKNLNSLTINFSGRRYDTKHRVELAKILKSLPTLRILKVNCQDFITAHKALGRSASSGITSEFLRFPSVKCLHLNQFPVPVSFVLRFPNLERLRIFPERRAFCEEWKKDDIDSILYPRGHHKLKVVRTAEIIIHEAEVYQSKVWAGCPSLVAINLNHKTYTRQGYLKAVAVAPKASSASPSTSSKTEKHLKTSK